MGRWADGLNGPFKALGKATQQLMADNTQKEHTQVQLLNEGKQPHSGPKQRKEVEVKKENRSPSPPKLTGTTHRENQIYCHPNHLQATNHTSQLITTMDNADE